jgi:ABC-type transporter Mla subunit MlaD
MAFEDLSFERIKQFLIGDKDLKKEIQGKEKETTEKLKNSYDNITTYVILQEEKLKDLIKETREKISEDLTDLRVVSKALKNDFGKDLKNLEVEIRATTKELVNSYENLIKTGEQLAKERNRYRNLMILFGMVIVFVVGLVAGYFVGSKMGKPENLLSVKQEKVNILKKGETYKDNYLK